MSKYNSACSSLRPGQLNRLVDGIKDSKPKLKSSENIGGIVGIIKNKIKVLEMIKIDMEQDAMSFDGRPFNGKTVAQYGEIKDYRLKTISWKELQYYYFRIRKGLI